MSVVVLNDVTLAYHLDPYRNLGVKEFFIRKIKHSSKENPNQFWALKGITFSLEKGDMVGIIGKNGAGKTSLLNVVSGIMSPTGGVCCTQGKIAALLELSSGFDGDMTIHENAFLRGALLGYSRAFMNEKYEQIIKFAELEGFEDRLFMQLSSGMKSRLAFSIASMLNPDILILDEVLSVGDGAFREKSMAKMHEIINSGATTLFVSHSIDQVYNACNKVLWLDHGKQIAFGETKPLCDAYVEYLTTNKIPSKI